MPITITDIVARDIRFPTSLEAAASDAMNDRPDSSAAHVIRGGRYLAPTAAGHSIEMKPDSLAAYAYPDGPVWTSLLQGR